MVGLDAGANPGQRLSPRRLSAARSLAVLGTVGSLLLVAALHVLRPELPAGGARLSEYASGAFAPLMTAAFLSAAVAVGALALVAASEVAGRAGSWLAAAAGLAAIGLVASGVFPTGGTLTAERVHSLASSTAAVATTAVAMGWSLRAGRRGQTALASAAVVLLLVSPVLHDTAVAGAGQRLLWACLLAWMIRAARGMTAGTATLRGVAAHRDRRGEPRHG